MTFVRQPDRLVVPGIVLGIVLTALGAFWSPLLWLVGGVAGIVAAYNFALLYRTYLGLWAAMGKG